MQYHVNTVFESGLAKLLNDEYSDGYELDQILGISEFNERIVVITRFFR